MKTITSYWERWRVACVRDAHMQIKSGRVNGKYIERERKQEKHIQSLAIIWVCTFPIWSADALRNVSILWVLYTHFYFHLYSRCVCARALIAFMFYFFRFCINFIQPVKYWVNLISHTGSQPAISFFLVVESCFFFSMIYIKGILSMKVTML